MKNTPGDGAFDPNITDSSGVSPSKPASPINVDNDVKIIMLQKNSSRRTSGSRVPSKSARMAERGGKLAVYDGI